jgi:GAF domain-containing protein
MASVSGPVDRAISRLRELCDIAVKTLPAAGAGVSVLAADGRYSLLTAADAVSDRLEEMQFLLGEGPCVEAADSGRPVFVADLDAELPSRWPAYSPSMREAGIRAVFAFPLQLGAAKLGVLDIFRTAPGPLTRSELARAFRLSDEAVLILMDVPGRTTAPGGHPGDDAAATSVELFQAQGMVMIQLGSTLAEAMARIRAYAYAENRRLIDVAHAVLTRDLRFDRDEKTR